MNYKKKDEITALHKTEIKVVYQYLMFLNFYPITFQCGREMAGNVIEQANYNLRNTKEIFILIFVFLNLNLDANDIT